MVYKINTEINLGIILSRDYSKEMEAKAGEAASPAAVLWLFVSKVISLDDVGLEVFVMTGCCITGCSIEVRGLAAVNSVIVCFNNIGAIYLLI